tara:strand:- start:316 stop:753 length:438 start_codon:yes stop_codon:yes gene_type:complete
MIKYVFLIFIPFFGFSQNSELEKLILEYYDIHNYHSNSFLKDAEKVEFMDKVELKKIETLDDYLSLSKIIGFDKPFRESTISSDFRDLYNYVFPNKASYYVICSVSYKMPGDDVWGADFFIVFLTSYEDTKEGISPIVGLINYYP